LLNFDTEIYNFSLLFIILIIILIIQIFYIFLFSFPAAL